MTRREISIITALYKSERYLKDFLDNVSELTNPELMTLFLNFSTPTEFELNLAERFKKSASVKVQIQINRKRISIAEASNQIIKSSKSRYLALWNVDDHRTTNSLSEQFKTLESTNADICIGPYIIHKKTHDGVDYKKKIDVGVSDQNEFTRGMLLGPFFMLRRALINRAGLWDEQFLSGGDFDWAVRLCRAGKVTRTEEILGTYLNVGSGASTTPNSLQPLEREVINLRYGIYDKVEVSFIPTALLYDLRRIKVSGKNYSIKDFFEGYDAFLSDRSKLKIRSESKKRRASFLKRLKSFLIWKAIQFRKY